MTQDAEAIRRLDTLIRLVAIGVCGERSQKEKIAILAAARLPPKEIAELLGTTANTVSVSLYGMKKDKGVKRPPRPVESNNE